MENSPNFGAPKTGLRIIATLAGIDEMARKEDAKLIDRIKREGNMGSGERRG